MGHKILYALFIEVSSLGCEPFLNTRLQLTVTVELLTSKKSLQVQEQMIFTSVAAPEEIFV
jgi:hypothetical protein